MYYLVLPLAGPMLSDVVRVQQRYDPRLAREWPPHATLAGSSGMGPVSAEHSVAELEAALAPIAAATPVLELPFGAAVRFMQTNVVVLPLDPHGPIRVLHESVKASGLRYGAPRFAFTPHVTLSFYPELTRDRAAELLSVRATAPARFERLMVYRSFANRTSRMELELELGGGG